MDGLASRVGDDAPRPDIALYDPGNDTLSEVWDTFDHPPGIWPSNHRLYCSGHSVLPDGGVVFRGGDVDPGNPFLSIYDQVSGSAGFVLGPVETIDFLQYTDKPTFRWYPSHVALPDGRVLIVDGWEKANIIYPPGDPPPPPYPATDWPHGNANIPVIFDPAQGPATAYTALIGAEYCQQTSNGPVPPDGDYGENCNPSAPNAFNMEEYPWMFLVSNGRVFYARSQYGRHVNFVPDSGSRRGRLLDTAGSGQWTDLGSGADAPIMGGCAVMYAKDRILMTGGASSTALNHFSGCAQNNDPLGQGFATNAAYVIDPVNPIPPANSVQWTAIQSMRHSRVNHYLVNLPDGTIMALGGSNSVSELGDPTEGYDSCPCTECGSTNQPCNLCNAVVQCERYIPWTNTWEALSSMSGQRIHHWVALLLPSGKVFAAGGQRTGFPSGQGQAQRTYEIYSPPYFNTPQSQRPAIVPSSLPALMQYDRPYNITLQTAMQITKVRLIRPGAVTHSIDMEGRMMELEFTQATIPGGGGFSPVVRVRAPEDNKHAPPGYYMLFLCGGTNGDNPSIRGEFVKIGS